MDIDAFDVPTHLVELLLEKVPNFREFMEQGEEEQSGRPLGPDAMFSLLSSFSLARLRGKNCSDDSVLQRVFELLEEFASSDDDDKHSLVDVSFGEAFLDDPEALAMSKEYLGPELKERLRRVQEVFKKPRK